MLNLAAYSHLKLTAYARLTLVCLAITPAQTFDELLLSTECPRRATIRDTLKLLQAYNLVTKSDAAAATYSLTPKEAADVQ